MRKFYLALFVAAFLFYSVSSHAQSTGINYAYSSGSNSWIANSSPVIIIAGGVDDQLVNISGAAFPATWSGIDYAGFTFTSATGIWISSNGFISLLPPGSSLPTNSLATNPYGIIAPFWDDLKTGPAGNVNYKFSGSGISEFLTIEWLQMLWDHNGATWAISFQIRLYERTHITQPSIIDFRYNLNGPGATNYNGGSGGASIGLSGFCAGDFFNFFNPGGAPTKAMPEVTSLISKPPATLYQRFAPITHPNDECASAQNLTFNSGLPIIQTLATTLHATPSALPAASCWNAAANYTDVWFTFSKPAGITNFELFTDSLDCRGANYGMGMEVYNSCGGAAIACDENSTGPAGTNATSYIILTGQPCAATTYKVRVKTDNSLAGYFRFNIRPPGRDCAYATDITSCVLPYNSPTLLSTCGFTNDFDSANSACGSILQTGEDYIFSYTPPSSGCINVSLNNTPSNSNPGLYIYRGCPASGVCLGSITSTGGSPLTFNSLTLASGYTYYFVVDYDSLTTSSCLSGFDLSVSAAGAAPSYDMCSSAVLLAPAVGSPPCTGAVTFNNNCATPSLPDTIITPNPGCGVFTAGITPDVWFTFTAPSIQAHQIVVNQSAVNPAQDLAMAVYTGTCAGFTLEACDDNTNGLMPSVAVLPPSVGTVYYIRIFSNDGTPPGGFNICIRYGCTPPNDLCINAILLTPGQPVYGDNSCSTGTNEPLAALGGPVCWRTGNVMNTVWYKFVATNSSMNIKTQLLTMYNSQIALYDGPCGSVMTERYCNDNFTWCNGAQDRNSRIQATGLVVGNTYYISVDGRTAGTGTFTILVNDAALPYPPSYAQDCIVPIALCNNATISVPNPGWVGEGNICDVPQGTANTCMLWGERRGVWYTFSVDGGAAGQTLQFSFSPNNVINHDWMMWAIDTVWNNNPNHVFPTVANYCSQLTNEAAYPLVVCNASLYSPTGCNSSAGTISIPPTVGPSVLSTTSNTFCCHGNSPAVFIPANVKVTFLLSYNHAVNLFESGYTLNWLGSAISSTSPSVTWINQVTIPSATWDGVSNAQAWVPNCFIPDCSTHPIPAFIAPGGVQPIINANVSVKDLTINAGAVLTINSGRTLTICGNFTNNGTLICQPTSTIKFIGNTNTTISGVFAPTGNSFYNVEFAKSAGSSVTLNTNIYILGNDSIYSGIVNNNSKITEVGGNFFNYNGSTSFTGLGSGLGGSTLSFTCRNNGGLLQQFRNDGVALTLNNVTINQIINSQVRLNAGAFSDMILGTGGFLTLTNGRIVTTAAAAREVFVMNATSLACNTGNINSYVEGNLRRAIGATASSYDFPVGDGTSVLAPGIVGYERANITFTTAPSAAFNLLSTFYRWSLGGVVYPGNGPVASECITATYSALPTFNHGYWRINDNGAASGIYRITLYNSGMNNNTGTGWTVVKAPAGTGTFSLSGACFVASTAAQTRRDNLTGFSDFTTVQSQTPLPIELLYFAAAEDGEDVNCTWSTASEINNDHFIIERSDDFENFTPVGKVNGYGSGVSTQVLSYRYVDEKICSGILYYRLKQVDVDGNFTYSNTVAVKCGKSKSNFSISPNPVNEKLLVHSQWRSGFQVTGKAVLYVTVYTMIGEKVMEDELSLNEQQTQISELDVRALQSGQYLIEVVSPETVFRSRFVKR